MFRKSRCYDMSDNMMWQKPMPKMKNDCMMAMPVDYNYSMKETMGDKCEMKANKKEMDPMEMMPGCKMQPVYECPVEKCVHRTICHEVPHVCPINTRIINHHVYKHTYSPCYTCCEENEICNVNEGSCCCFR